MNGANNTKRNQKSLKIERAQRNLHSTIIVVQIYIYTCKEEFTNEIEENKSTIEIFSMQ